MDEYCRSGSPLRAGSSVRCREQQAVRYASLLEEPFGEVALFGHTSD